MIERLAEMLAACNTSFVLMMCEEVRKGSGLGEIMTCAEELTRKHCCAMVGAVLRCLDEDLQANTPPGMEVNQRRTKTVLTVPGEVTVPATVYRVREDGSGKGGKAGWKYVRPLVDALGLTPHQKLSDELQERLVAASLEMSDTAAIRSVAHGGVSKPTVGRRIDRMPVPAYPVPGWVHEAGEIHVIADEDHVALQKDKDGKDCKILPVAAVTPGKRLAEDGRTRLVEPVFFCEKDHAELGRVLEGYLMRHAVEDVSLHVHSDGAPQLVGLLGDVPHVDHICDAFHVMRRAGSFLRMVSETPARRKKNGEDLRKSIQDGDREGTEKLVDKLLGVDENSGSAGAKDAGAKDAGVRDAGAKDAAVKDAGAKDAGAKDGKDRRGKAGKDSNGRKEKERRRKGESFKKFLFSHWEMIVASCQDDRFGCCSEAIVEHVLSSSLSFFPTAHCSRRAVRRGRLRAAVRNGCQLRLRPSGPPENTGASLAEYADNYIADLMASPTSFAVFEKSDPPFDFSSATRHLIRQIGAGGQCKACVAL